MTAETIQATNKIDLSAKALRDSTLLVLQATIRPSRLSSIERNAMIHTILRGVSVILLLAMTLLIVTGFANYRQIMEANESIAGLAQGGIRLYDNPSPLGRLLFPVYFALIYLFVGAVRNGTMKLFGEENRSFLSAVAISAFALVPFVLSSTLQSIINNIYPYVPSPEQSNAPFIRIYSSLFLTLAVIIWEGVLCISLCRSVFGQNRGRAFLTWLSPFIVVVLFLVSIGMIFQLFVQA